MRLKALRVDSLATAAVRAAAKRQRKEGDGSTWDFALLVADEARRLLQAPATPTLSLAKRAAQ